MTTTVPTVILNNGVEMPMLGYDVLQTPPDETEHCVAEALEVGYRLIDTAQAYANEEGAGAAVAAAGVPRDEIFITSKIRVSNMNHERAAASIDESLEKLGTDHIDLMLLHQAMSDYPGPTAPWRRRTGPGSYAPSASRTSTPSASSTSPPWPRSHRR